MATMILDAIGKLPSTFWQVLGLIVLFAIVKALMRPKRARRTRIEPTLSRKRSDELNPSPPNRKSETDLYPLWKQVGQSEAPLARVDTSRWSLELLRAIEWKRLEQVCAAYFEALGFRTAVAGIGPDGGVDVHLYVAGTDHPAIAVQCKAWPAEQVGVKLVRELYGVMARDNIPEGIFITTGTFTLNARAFPKGDDLHLVDGEGFLEKILALPDAKQSNLLKLATAGDFTTPTCPSCGSRMTSRLPKGGGAPFWGCTNFPRCRGILNMRSS